MDVNYFPFITEKEFESLQGTPDYFQFLRNKVQISFVQSDSKVEDKDRIHEYLTDECKEPVFVDVSLKYICTIYFYSREEMDYFLNSKLFTSD